MWASTAHFAGLLLWTAASITSATPVDTEPLVMEVGVDGTTLLHPDGHQESLLRRESIGRISEHYKRNLPVGISETVVPVMQTSNHVHANAGENSSAYAESVMSSHPIGYWSMADARIDQEGDVTTVRTSAQGRACGVPGGLAAGDPCLVDGEVQGSPALRNGLLPSNGVNKAMNFSGADNEEVVIPDSHWINTDATGYRERTVELWFETDTPGDVNRTLYCEGNEQHSGLSMYVHEDNSLNVWLNMFAWDRGNHDAEFGTTLVNPDPIRCAIQKETPYYVVMEFNGKNHSFTGYIGRPQGGVELCGRIDIPLNVRLRHHGHGGGNAVIGGINVSSRASGHVEMLADSHNFKGSVDEVAIYNRALNYSEILAHWDKGSTTA